MELSTYIDGQRTDVRKFAAELGVTQEAVRLWINRKRLPRPDMMSKIVEATGGAVQPADFYQPAEQQAS